MILKISTLVLVLMVTLCSFVTMQTHQNFETEADGQSRRLNSVNNRITHRRKRTHGELGAVPYQSLGQESTHKPLKTQTHASAWSLVQKTSKQKWPHVNKHNRVESGLKPIRGLPTPFDPTRCDKLPDSEAWVKKAERTEDLMKMGDSTQYWRFVYAIECAMVVAPPSTRAAKLRAKLLDHIGDMKESIATLRYALRLSPHSPAVKWDLAEALSKYVAKNPRARKQLTEARQIYQELLTQSCDRADVCYELAAIRGTVEDFNSSLECLEKAVSMDLANAGYASRLWAQTISTSIEQIRKIRRLFSFNSRNYHIWNTSIEKFPLQNVDAWIRRRASKGNASASSSYTTASLLGIEYSVNNVDDELLVERNVRRDILNDDVTHILQTSGTRLTKIKNAMTQLLEPEQPEVCDRVRRLSTEGPTRLLYSLASPKTSQVNSLIGKDSTGKSKLDFGSITSDLLDVDAAPFGTVWERKPWPMFPMYMVGIIRSICDCAELECSLASRTWLMDADEVRNMVSLPMPSAVHAINEKDPLGYTPVALSIIQNDVLSYIAFLETGAIDFSAEDVWGHSIIQLFYMVTPTPQILVMHKATSQFTQARGGLALPPISKVRALQLPKFHELDVAEGWDPTTRTLPWAPLAEWSGSHYVDDVDSSQVSMADIVDKYISVGRPVVIKGAFRNCIDEMRAWSKDSLKESELANVTYKAYTGESSVMTTFAEFIDKYMSTGTLTDQSQPRYILAQKGSVVMENELSHVTEVGFLTNLLKCVPYELQEYLHLPPPELPGVWAQYTLSMGGAGAGASFHMHEAAINFVIYGTRKWYVYPPTHSTYTNMPMFHWVRDVLPTLPQEQRPIEFIQESGDIVFLPSWWAHGTVSVGDTLGFFKVMNNKLDHKNPTGPLKEITESQDRHSTFWANRELRHSPLSPS